MTSHTPLSTYKALRHAASINVGLQRRMRAQRTYLHDRLSSRDEDLKSLPELSDKTCGEVG
jgi:hypothetical protein